MGDAICSSIEEGTNRGAGRKDSFLKDKYKCLKDYVMRLIWQRPLVDDNMAPMGDVQICEAVYILESGR